MLKKIILCLPDRSFKRDYDHASEHKRTENYQKLVWTLEIICDYLEEKHHKLRITDIEMTLFMIGEQSHAI